MAPEMVRVEKLVCGGLGLARNGNAVTLIEGVLPDELTTMRPTGRKGDVTFAVADRIIEASPYRRDPPCPLAAACGGCDWQHIVYDHQRHLKKEIFLECLWRQGGIRLAHALEEYASPEFGYRHRVRIQIDTPHGCVGFFGKRSNTIVPLESCPVCAPAINDLLAGMTRHCSARQFTDGECAIIAGTDGACASSPVIPGLTKRHAVIGVDGHSFEVSGDIFFQGNRPLLEAFGAWARPFRDGAYAIDMYGGCGFFSVMVQACFRRILCVEGDPRLTALARRTFERNGLGHLAATTVSAEDFVRTDKSLRDADCLIVDPPRAGLSRVVRDAIGACAPATILSVSCDPATQARDCGFFVNRCGYAIERAALFDLYPNTHHVETMVLLRKQSRNAARP